MEVVTFFIVSGRSELSISMVYESILNYPSLPTNKLHVLVYPQRDSSRASYSSPSGLP